MVRLFVLGFLYLNITASFIVSGTIGADETVDAETNDCVIVTRKTPTRYSPYEIFVPPRAFPQFNCFFQNKHFWISKDIPLNPKAFLTSHPQLLLNSISSTLLDTHLKDMLSNKLVLNDVTRLSNQLLKIYGLKNRSGLPMSFNLFYDYDNAVLHKALFSFLSIINTPNPKAKEYEWRTQSFVKVFSQLCSSLNISEEDTELNLSMRKIVAFSLGLSPVNYDEWFQKQYPALAKWMKTCTCNNSKKPLAATLTLSFMHALTRKVNTSLLEQLYLPPMVQNENETTSPACLIVCPIPRRPIPEQIVGAPDFGPYFNSRTPLLRPMIPSTT
jgi:hypothetical protein